MATRKHSSQSRDHTCVEVLPDATTAILERLDEMREYLVTVTLVTDEYFAHCGDHNTAVDRVLSRNHPPPNDPWLPSAGVYLRSPSLPLYTFPPFISLFCSPSLYISPSLLPSLFFSPQLLPSSFYHSLTPSVLSSLMLLPFPPSTPLLLSSTPSLPHSLRPLFPHVTPLPSLYPSSSLLNSFPPSLRPSSLP